MEFNYKPQKMEFTVNTLQRKIFEKIKLKRLINEL